MDKNKFFTAIITIGIAIVILLVIVHITFSKNNSVNEGSFRVSDTIISSIVELEDKSESASEWKFDISQNNKISMLVQTVGEATIKEVYLEKVKVSSKNDVHIYIEQDNYELSYKYEEVKNKKVDIYIEETEEGNYLVEFDINNQDVVSDFVVPDDVKEIRHDGTMLNLAGISISDIQFKVRYNLVVVQDQGRLNTCKIEIEMPNSKIITEGFVTERLSSLDFKFKVNY